MKVDPQEYLDLVEAAAKLVFVDIESTGLKGDYNSILCVSFKPYGKAAYTFTVKSVGNDQRLVREVKDELEKYSCWVTYFGRGFDLPMINTRLLKWGLLPVDQRFHLDMYWKLKSGILTGRRSQGHLLAWLGTPEQKMTVGASTWSEMGYRIKEHLPLMVKRCESDVRGLEALYKKTRHLVRDITR